MSSEFSLSANALKEPYYCLQSRNRLLDLVLINPDSSSPIAALVLSTMSTPKEIKISATLRDSRKTLPDNILGMGSYSIGFDSVGTFIKNFAKLEDGKRAHVAASVVELRRLGLISNSMAEAANTFTNCIMETDVEKKPPAEQVRLLKPVIDCLEKSHSRCT